MNAAIFALVLAIVVVFLHISPSNSAPVVVNQPLVTRDSDGKLTYHPDPQGYTLIDYSFCGYHATKKQIPHVKSVLTLEPSTDNTDDTARIQEAIDSTQNGAILFKRGTYRVKGTLRIRKSNIVLRGEGNSATGTVIIATGTAVRDLIVVSGSSRITTTNKQPIVGDHLTGKRSFKVQSAADFKVGDLVAVVKTPNNQWVTDLGTNRIPPRSNGVPSVQWTPADYQITYERIVTAVNDNLLTLDVALPDSIQTKYGGGYISKIQQATSGVEEVGIERLRLVSEFVGDINKDEKHAESAIVFESVFNSWVADVVAEHFVYAAVRIRGRSKFNTVQDSANLDPASLITGGRRYAFSLESPAAFNQFIRLRSTNGRHDLVTGKGVPGPNVFYNATITQSRSDVGPHHRWASGLLFDNIRSDGPIAVENRGNMGTGHGWSGVSTIYWNVRASRAMVCSPPVGGNNYLIGVDAPIRPNKPNDCKPGVIKDDLSADSIPSLYEAQLYQRTGKTSSQLFPRRRYSAVVA